MKKILQPIFTALLCIGLLNACKKGFNDQQTQPPNPQQPDLVTQASISVSGFVTNENGDAAIGALVKAGTASTITNQYGYFKIKDVSLSKTAPFIRISKEGYFESYRTFVYEENKEAFTRVKLVPKTIAGTFNAASGGSVNTFDGGIVSLPANALVNAGTNVPYSGNVHLAAHLFKQGEATEFANTAPGDNRGISSDGYLQIRKSYGMMAVELIGDAGELLQIAPGKEATITTPIPSSLAASAPAGIPLWNFDTSKGLWKQESSATKSGNTYVGNVSHFSFWDVAVGLPIVNFTVQIVDSSLNPIPNLFVRINYAGQYYGATGYTNGQGVVSGAVPDNGNFELQVLSLCNLPVYSYRFTAAGNNIDLGTIIGDFGANAITIKGTAVNCTQSPITDGMLIVYGGINWFTVPIVNGNFNFSVPACSNLSLNYVVMDNATHQQGTATERNFMPGINNLGQLQACGTNTETYFHVTFDNPNTINGYLDTTYIESLADSIFFTFPTNELTQVWVRANGSSGHPERVSCLFNGAQAPGGDHPVSYVTFPKDAWGWQPGSNSLMPLTSPTQVTVTELSDEFVTGSCSGIFQDGFGMQYTLNYSFRAKKHW